MYDDMCFVYKSPYSQRVATCTVHPSYRRTVGARMYSACMRRLCWCNYVMTPTNYENHLQDKLESIPSYHVKSHFLICYCHLRVKPKWK